MKRAILIGLLVVTAGALRAADPPVPKKDPVITSDQLELQDNGALTIFRGHVVLTQEPYVLTADRMERVKSTENVNAYGNIRGTWISDKGEKMVATGGRGRYRPQDQTIELWDHPKLMRWETATDTSPVVVTAKYFIAYQNEKIILAKREVYMEQLPRMKARARYAKYDQKEQVLHLWGPDRVAIHVADGKATGDFLSDRALVTLSPKKARLMDRVTGHVIPAKT